MLCFGKFSVANKSMDERGGVSKFSVEFLCLNLPKLFVGDPFSVSIISGTEKG